MSDNEFENIDDEAHLNDYDERADELEVHSAAFLGVGIEVTASRTYTDANGNVIIEDFQLAEIKTGKLGRGGKIQRKITTGKTAGKFLNIVDYTFGNPHGGVYSGNENAFYSAALKAFMAAFKNGGVLVDLPAQFTFSVKKEDFDATLSVSYPNSFK